MMISSVQQYLEDLLFKSQLLFSDYFSFICWHKENMAFEIINKIWSKLKTYDLINIFQNLHVSLSSLDVLWFLHKLQLHCAVHIPHLDLLHPQEKLAPFSRWLRAHQSLLYSYLCHLIRSRQKEYLNNLYEQKCITNISYHQDYLMTMALIAWWKQDYKIFLFAK